MSPDEAVESIKTECPSCFNILYVVRRPLELERRRKPRCIHCGNTFQLTPEGEAIPDGEVVPPKSPHAR